MVKAWRILLYPTERDKQLFLKHLSAVVKLDTPLPGALRFIAGEMRSLPFRRSLEQIATSIESGVPVADAFEEHSRYFSPAFIAALRTGELTRMGDTLARYELTRLRVTGISGRWSTMMIYPQILFTIWMIISTFIVKFSVPEFNKFLTKAGVPLPLANRVLMYFSGYWLSYVIGLCLVLVVIYLLLRHYPSFTTWIPLVGKWNYYYQYAQFSAYMELLLKSGVRLPASLRVAAQSAPLGGFRKQIEQVADEIEKGEGIEESFRACGVFPETANLYIAMGVELGTLPDSFHEISNHFEKRLQNSSERMVRIAEPVFIIFMGIVVLITIASIYGPLFRTIGAL